MNLPYNEYIDLFQNNLDKMESLGQISSGTYGTVHKVRFQNLPDQVFAMKHSKNKSNDGVPLDIFREISLTSQFDSDEIVKIVFVSLNCEDQSYNIFYEYYDCDLRRYYKEYKLDLRVIKSILYRIISGLEQLHSRQIIHRDIKPNNILVSNKKISLADFGLAQRFSIPLQQYLSRVGTPNYRSPQLVQQVNDKAKDKKNQKPYYATGVDMWAVGCIALELITQVNYFKSGNDIDLMNEHIDKLGAENFLNIYPNVLNSNKSNKLQNWLEQLKQDEKLDENFVDLVLGLLDPNELTRLDAIQALRSPFFDDVENDICFLEQPAQKKNYKKKS